MQSRGPPPPSTAPIPASMNRGGPPQYQGAPPPSGIQPPSPIATTPTPAPSPAPPAPRIDPSQIPRVPWGEVGIADAPWSSSLLLGPASDPKILPPVASKPFTATDSGNATPRFIRPTLHHFPASKDVAASAAQPLGVIVSPMAKPEEVEDAVPRVDFSQNGPIRCTRCKGYVNPFVSWLSKGDSWGCNLCGMVNATPDYYRCPLNGSNERVDAASRPELSYGSVDLIATSSYCVRPVQEPIYVFVIDTTPAAFLCGFTQSLVDIIIQVVEASLPATESSSTEQPSLSQEEVEGDIRMPPLKGGPKAKVGIVSFNHEVTYHRLSSNNDNIYDVVMSDVNDPFCPLPPTEWLLSVEGGLGTKIKSLGEHILKRAQESAEKALSAVQESKLSASGSTSKTLPGLPSGCMTAALASVSDGLHKVGGRVLLFSHSAPLIGAGRLRPREHPNDYGTDREAHMWRALTPNTAKSKEDKESANYYAQLADSCALRQISVNLFLTDGGAYGNGGGADRRGGMGGWSDIATLTVLPTTTGGRMNFFPGGITPQGQLNYVTKQAIRGNVMCTLKSACADEAVLKIRCSQGLRCTEYHGIGVQHHPEEMEIAACDEWASFYCALKHDSAVKNNSRIFVQAALLYSSPEGYRMVRVHTLCLIAAELLPDVFRLADLDAIFCANIQGQDTKKGFIHRSLSEEPASLESLRNSISNTCAEALFCYRTTCAQSSPAGQLVLPESLKLFPFYSLGLLKSIPFRENSKLSSGGGDSEPDPRADERSYQLHLLKAASPYVMHRLLHPRLFNLANFDPTYSQTLSPTNNMNQTTATSNNNGHGHDQQADRGDTSSVSHVLAPGAFSPKHSSSNPNTPAAGSDKVLPGERMVNGRIALPHPVYCSAASLGEDKVMLLDAGHVIYLWVGRSVDSIILLELFGVEELDPKEPPQKLSSGGKVVELIKEAIIELRRDLPFYPPLKIIASGPGSMNEHRFMSLLIEDKTKHQMSYVDYLCQIHRSIQKKM